MDGGSVLLETFAPQRAIISQIHYPMLNPNQIRNIKRKHPGIMFDDFSHEREYIVDRRYLIAVTVIRRYT